MLGQEECTCDYGNKPSVSITWEEFFLSSYGTVSFSIRIILHKCNYYLGIVKMLTSSFKGLYSFLKFR